MEDCRSKIRGKENILFDLPSPHPVLGGGNDTNDVIIAADCAHQQVLMQDILFKTIKRQIGRKVPSFATFLLNLALVVTGRDRREGPFSFCNIS